jgi:hypothetical protein
MFEALGDNFSGRVVGYCGRGRCECGSAPVIAKVGSRDEGPVQCVIFENIPLVDNGSVNKVPVAVEKITSPLGSPTAIPPPAFKFFNKEESVLRKIVFVAPVSWIGVGAVLSEFRL